MELALDEKFTPEGRKTKVHVTRVKGTAAQAMINWSEGISQVEICRHWKDLRMKVPLYQGPEFGNRRMVKITGGKADGVLCPVGRLMLME